MQGSAMRKLGLISILLSATAAVGQISTPQTARQALLDMFFSKAQGTFVKHLPEATKAALEKGGALQSVQMYSTMVSQLQARDKDQDVQTFETGSLLLETHNSKTGEKAQIVVVKDAMRGDRDDIELSLRLFKDGKEQRMPFLPQVVFSMKQEAAVWKLNEIAVTIYLPLADPDFLKALTEKMAAPANTSAVPVKIDPEGTATATARNTIEQQEANNVQVIAAVKAIVAAETEYAQTYRQVGYTCVLSSLDGFGSGTPNENQAMLLNSGLAAGRKYGYVFTLSKCEGSPAWNFQLVAAPNSNSFPSQTFCTDRTGTIRAAEDAARCVQSGSVVK